MGIDIANHKLFITGLCDDEILKWVLAHYPGAEEILRRLQPLRWKGSVYPYQAALVYMVASAFNFPGANFLEIGTYYGYTAAVMAEAAPSASIITINPTPWEQEKAAENLRGYKNVHSVLSASLDYYSVYAGEPFCFIFVDADHKRVSEDLRWWNRLEPGGVMLFHDYSPDGSIRACPPVYRAMTELRRTREPDILIVDDNQVGMIGFRKKAGEELRS